MIRFLYKKNLVTTLVLIVVFLSVSFLYNKNIQANIKVDLIVQGCNNNFICEPQIGEDVNTCPNDCLYNPPSPPTDYSGRSGSIGSQASIEIDSTIITSNSITVFWNSNIPVNTAVAWSSGDQYEIGRIQEVGFTNQHVFTLSDLQPNIIYVITIFIQDLYGNTTSKVLTYKTSEAPVQTSTIKNFEISQYQKGLLLTWTNPSQSFDHVRIVRSEVFFPSDMSDGLVIYEGSGNSFFDSNIEQDTRYYYSIFTKDSKGFSSGVSQSGILYKQKEDFFESGQPVDIFGPIIIQQIVTPIQDSILKNHINILQNGKEVTYINNVYYVQDKKDITISIDRTNQIPFGSELFISYLNSSSSLRAENYVFKYDSILNKYIVSFRIDNATDKDVFIIYIKNNNQIRGYSGYFEIIDFGVISEKKSVFYFFNDLLFSLLMLILISYTIARIIFLYVFKKHFVLGEN